MGLRGAFSKSVIAVGVMAMIAFSLLGCVSGGEREASQTAVEGGTTVSASGTNSFPDGYGEFERGIAALLESEC